MKLLIILGLLLFSTNTYSECRSTKNEIICSEGNTNYNWGTSDGGNLDLDFYSDDIDKQYVKILYQDCLNYDSKSCEELEIILNASKYK